MVYIVLRTGKVLQYNNAYNITVKDNTFVLGTRGGTGLVARIPLDIVERAEFKTPCEILKALPIPKSIKKLY